MGGRHTNLALFERKVTQREREREKKGGKKRKKKFRTSNRDTMRRTVRLSRHLKDFFSLSLQQDCDEGTER